MPILRRGTVKRTSATVEKKTWEVATIKRNKSNQFKKRRGGKKGKKAGSWG